MRGAVIVASPDSGEKEAMIKGVHNYGYEVLGASTGAEAVELIHHPKGLTAIVLSSGLTLPSTLDICKEIKAGKRSGKVPVFILENAALDRKPYADLGINKFFVRPFSTGTIAREIHETEKVAGALGTPPKKIVQQFFWVAILLGVGAIILAIFIFYPLFFGGK